VQFLSRRFPVQILTHRPSHGCQSRRATGTKSSWGAPAPPSSSIFNATPSHERSAAPSASTLPIQNARQPSWAFCCALGGWWLGRCGVAGAPGAHLQGGQGPNVGWRAFYTGIFGNTLATYAPIPAVIFSFSLLLSTPDPGPGCTWPGWSSWVPTSISNTRLRGTQAQKPRPRSEKPWRWAWP